jgi:hypothetical protein
MEAALEERHRLKIAKSAKQLNRQELDQAAENTLSAHDQAWSTRGDIQYARLVEKVATKTHFNSVEVKNDAFFNELVNVLPFLGESLNPPTTDRDATKAALKKAPYKTKKEIMKADGIVGKHLGAVKLIASDKEENTFSVELGDMTADQILQTFVHADRSMKLEQLKEIAENEWKLLHDIYKISASTIKPKYLQLMNSAAIDEEDDESDVEDTEEE